MGYSIPPYATLPAGTGGNTPIASCCSDGWIWTGGEGLVSEVVNTSAAAAQAFVSSVCSNPTGWDVVLSYGNSGFGDATSCVLTANGGNATDGYTCASAVFFSVGAVSVMFQLDNEPPAPAAAACLVLPTVGVTQQVISSLRAEGF